MYIYIYIFIWIFNKNFHRVCEYKELFWKFEFRINLRLECCVFLGVCMCVCLLVNYTSRFHLLHLCSLYFTTILAYVRNRNHLIWDIWVKDPVRCRSKAQQSELFSAQATLSHSSAILTQAPLSEVKHVFSISYSVHWTKLLNPFPPNVLIW